MGCKGFWECLLKLLNFLLMLVGLAMVGYGIYLFVEYKNSASSGGDEPLPPSSQELVQLGRPMLLAVSLADSIFDKLPKAWFIYLFIGIGVAVLFVACCGCIGTATRNGCCLTCFSILVILLILVELGLAAFIFFDKSWQEEIPTDKTGNFDEIYKFLKGHWEIVKWVALGAVILEAVIFLLALIVRAANRPADYDSDEEYIGAPRQQIRQPLINRQPVPATGVSAANTLDQRPSRNDAWSTRMREKIGYEFNFLREADAMEKIRRFLYENNKKSPVSVPRLIGNMNTRRVLVMEYIDGIPILRLGDEIAKRGINPDGKVAAAAKQNILKSLTLAYGQMILKSGFFHADPHPGNILICRGSEVALLDYGQVKDLPDQLRLGYASLVLALADNDPTRASESYRELGIDTLSKCKDEQTELFRLAQTMFDTKLPPGVTMLQPFSEESSIKKIAVEAFPEELFSVLRTVHLLRGLSVGLGINYSCAEQWRPIAEEALYLAGRLSDKDLKTTRIRKRGFFRGLFGR